MRLLQMAITGCRDAARHGELARSKCEYQLARALRNAVTSSDQAGVAKQACDAYASAASKLDDEVMKSRSRNYDSLLELTLSDGSLYRPAWDDVSSSAIVGIIDVALTFIGDALSDGDLARVRIESEHIHNLPSHLIPGNAKSQKYYLNAERNDYLESIRENFGLETANEVAKQYQTHWNELATTG
jgi:hypothetical protein